jgi:hypothetical protein
MRRADMKAMLDAMSLEQLEQFDGKGVGAHFEVDRKRTNAERLNSAIVEVNAAVLKAAPEEAARAIEAAGGGPVARDGAFNDVVAAAEEIKRHIEGTTRPQIAVGEPNPGASAKGLDAALVEEWAAFFARWRKFYARLSTVPAGGGYIGEDVDTALADFDRELRSVHAKLAAAGVALPSLPAKPTPEQPPSSGGAHVVPLVVGGGLALGLTVALLRLKPPRRAGT